MARNITTNSFKDFCPRCTYYEEETGVCKKIYANVREYPRKFLKKCNGEYFEHDPNKVVEEIEKFEDHEPKGTIQQKEVDRIPDDLKLVTVYIPEHEAEHLAILSLLESAGIECYSKNAGVQNLFGLGQIGTGFNVAAGPIEIQVSENKLEEAKEVINSGQSTSWHIVIPDICPACNFATQKLPQCPNCGFKFILNDNNIEQNGTSEPEHQGNPQKAFGSFRAGIVTGFTLSAVFFLGFFALYDNPQTIKQPQSYQITFPDDVNGDGVPDFWVEYADGRIVKTITDFNFDGMPDIWSYYNNNGQINLTERDLNFDGNVDSWQYYENGLMIRSESDYNFDGRPDYWEIYEGGISIKYTADNDYDGNVDEWGLLENGQVKERNWSFQNDGIVDKKAVYKFGRKVSEAYDRDRDGEFEEVIFLDEFERVKNIANK